MKILRGDAWYLPLWHLMKSQSPRSSVTRLRSINIEEVLSVQWQSYLGLGFPCYAMLCHALVAQLRPYRSNRGEACMTVSGSSRGRGVFWIFCGFADVEKALSNGCTGR